MDYFCLKLLSSSSWGCELKFSQILQKFLLFSSSSSWGCELKYQHGFSRTGKSYVILLVRMWVEMLLLSALYLRLCCHPPREDVSWNANYDSYYDYQRAVILLVRMWVEMVRISRSRGLIGVILLVRMWVEISNVRFSWLSPKGHPPREDVSWNTATFYNKHITDVILLVRMWVEMSLIMSLFFMKMVILLVRMWVEIS